MSEVLTMYSDHTGNYCVKSLHVPSDGGENLTSLYMHLEHQNSSSSARKNEELLEKVILKRKERLVKYTHLFGSLDLLDDAEKHNIQKLHSQGFNEEKEGEFSTKRVRKRKLPKRKSTDIDNDRISDEQMAHFDHIFCDLNLKKMWILKSDHIVEKIIYEYARTLKYGSCLHSFIISNIDEKAKSLFQNEEWKEIFFSNCKKMPKIDKSVIELLKKYSDDNNFTLDSSKLEGWFQHNIWSSIIDPSFHINSRINLICEESMSLASSDRKNDTSCNVNHRTSSSDSCDVNRKKISRKGDEIFRLKGNRLEFRAIEAERK
ncbi:5274_t:CDS:2 [Funneliformis caledonium]|uniref:5274_t:CDS:1 n=1 Tax=Funneliformis caledonium TaxID=1117310 RepID=A0A9N9NBQ7_9GLOM|nr:5274_t:CDS:2 [Funneliformis caledonium]